MNFFDMLQPWGPGRSQLWRSLLVCLVGRHVTNTELALRECFKSLCRTGLCSGRNYQAMASGKNGPGNKVRFLLILRLHLSCRHAEFLAILDHEYRGLHNIITSTNILGVPDSTYNIMGPKPYSNY